MEHDVELKHINELINKNIKRFTSDDLLDLKVVAINDHNLDITNFGYSNMQVAKANNIYVLSERGYMKLVDMMDNTNEKKWEVMDNIINNYYGNAIVHDSVKVYGNAISNSK